MVIEHSMMFHETKLGNIHVVQTSHDINLKRFVGTLIILIFTRLNRGQWHKSHKVKDK